MTVGLKETDVLPPMRTDLEVVGVPHPTTGDLVAVKDPVSGRTVRFRGFELSLARLLDGKRTAQDVLDAARGLGIPLTLAGLQNFGAKLNSIGFLVKAGAPAPSNKTTWRPRPLWSPEVREQFRAALKDAREDRLDQARGYLEQVLKADPTVQDAIELIAWIEKRKQTLAKPAVVVAPPVAKGDPTTVNDRMPPVDILGTAPDTSETRSFGEIFADADQGWYADAASMEDSLGPPKKSRSGLRVVGIALVGIAAGALLIPIPRTVTARVTLAAEDDVAITAPQAGRVSAVKVPEGQWVEAEQTLLELAPVGRAERLADLEKLIAEFEARPKPKKKAKDDTAEKLRKAKSERASLQQKSGGTPVTALTSGFVRGLSVHAGDMVEADAALCRVVASKHLIAKVEVPFGAPVASGQKATLKFAGKPLEVTLESANKTTAEATLNNEDASLEVGARGEALIQLGARSFLQL